MIAREIKEKPVEVLKDFDWFNDYTDTRKWCRVNCPSVIDRLDKGYTNWLHNKIYSPVG